MGACDSVAGHGAQQWCWIDGRLLQPTDQLVDMLRQTIRIPIYIDRKILTVATEQTKPQYTYCRIRLSAWHFQFFFNCVRTLYGAYCVVPTVSIPASSIPFPPIFKVYPTHIEVVLSFSANCSYRFGCLLHSVVEQNIVL